MWSGNETKVRLSRGGNRQIDTALHMIAVTQVRGMGPGADYIAKRIALGDDKTEALRLLRHSVMVTGSGRGGGLTRASTGRASGGLTRHTIGSC